jgi:hypothetical protein
VPLYGHSEPFGNAANDTFEHCCAASVCSSAKSGMPVALPALSLQLSMPLTSERNSAVVPVSASEFVHAPATAALLPSGLRCESTCFTSTWRHARPPLALM